MKHFLVCAVLSMLMLLTSACGTGDDALGRVTSAMNDYQAGNGQAFEQQITAAKRYASAQCPGGLQYGCLQLAYKNFAAAQQAGVASPQSFTLTLYPKQTMPEVQMVLVEGNWGGNPAIVSCQVFFVVTKNSTWLIDNFDNPDALTCQQRSQELTDNLFGSATGGPTPTNP